MPAIEIKQDIYDELTKEAKNLNISIDEYAEKILSNRRNLNTAEDERNNLLLCALMMNKDLLDEEKKERILEMEKEREKRAETFYKK